MSDLPFSSKMSRGQFDLERMFVKVRLERMSEPAVIEMSAFVNEVIQAVPLNLISSSVVCVAEDVSMNCPLLTATLSVEIVKEALT